MEWRVLFLKREFYDELKTGCKPDVYEKIKSSLGNSKEGFLDLDLSPGSCINLIM